MGKQNGPYNADFPPGTRFASNRASSCRSFSVLGNSTILFKTSNWITLDRSPRSIRSALTSAQTNFTHYKAFAESGMNLAENERRI